jgi:hypothetical protein
MRPPLPSQPPRNVRLGACCAAPPSSSRRTQVPALLPLLRLRGPESLPLVVAAVRVLEGYVDFNAGLAAGALAEAGGLQARRARPGSAEGGWGNDA